MNAMQEAMQELREAMGDPVDGAGVTVTYYNEIGDSFQPAGCWQGQTPFRVEDGDNNRVVWREFDLLIPVASLKLNGVLFEPKQGHWITIVLPDPYGTQRFEVNAPNNEQVFRYMDHECTVYRVHFKRMVYTP